jgi:hypothetical protein
MIYRLLRLALGLSRSKVGRRHLILVAVRAAIIPAGLAGGML